MDSHTLQLLQVVSHGTGRIVGQEGIADASLLQVIKETDSIGENILPEIDGAVHVQGDVFDAGKFLPHFRGQLLVVILFHINFHLLAFSKFFRKYMTIPEKLNGYIG